MENYFYPLKSSSNMCLVAEVGGGVGGLSSAELGAEDPSSLSCLSEMVGSRSTTRTRHSLEWSSIVTRCLAVKPHSLVTTRHLHREELQLAEATIGQSRGGAM